jgi:hypothetical protein
MANLKSMTIMWTTDVICILLIEMEKEALAYLILCNKLMSDFQFMCSFHFYRIYLDFVNHTKKEHSKFA